MTPYNNTIVDYIKMINENINLENVKQVQEEKSKLILDDIYKIIYNSVFEREKLLYINKVDGNKI